MDQRVQFDFEVDFLNGGGIQGQDYRLDIAGDDISDAQLADLIVQDLRLLMTGAVRIRNKRIIQERHKRASVPNAVTVQSARFIDLSHAITEGMITLRGFPAPIICDFISREASKKLYAKGTSFQMGKIEMAANTGTYIDSPFHRFENGKDISELDLASLADLESVVVRVEGMKGRAVDRHAFAATDVRGKAVLVHTGWAGHWGTEQYFDNHPFLTKAAAVYLQEQGAVLVGIDSLNIDDTNDGERPVHTVLLGSGILIVEHLRGLEQLPAAGFTFTAAPAKVRAIGSFPVRAFAKLL
jgi:arylformamidase